MRLRPAIPALPAVLVVGLVIALPVGWLFLLSFQDDQGWTLDHYIRMVENEGYWLSLRVTLLVGLVVTAASAVVGYPIAYLVARTTGRRARILLFIVLLPLWTSLLVRTFAWLVLLQRRGLINELLQGAGLTDGPLPLVNNLFGTAVGITHVMLPYMILVLQASIRAVDRRLEHAAASLGAPPARVFLDVTFRHSLPGLFAGCVTVFVMTLGFFVMPALLGGGQILMWSMKIVTSVNRYSDWGAASSMGVVLLLVVALLLWSARRVAGRLLAVEQP